MGFFDRVFKTLLAQDPALMLGNTFPAKKTATIRAACGGFTRFVVVTSLMGNVFQILILIPI